MLDADLAEIYGYDTKGFNRQVKNNIEKFDEDFMFELTDEELEDLRYKNCTANISSKSRYNPHVFTEQGLYMLMTVLKGPLAVKQSKALIRTFKKMKDYILENRDLIGQREILQLSMETANERVFLGGASSKDAGARITSIIKKIIDNPVYMGKIAYGRRRTEKKTGTYFVRNIRMSLLWKSSYPC